MERVFSMLLLSGCLDVQSTTDTHIQKPFAAGPGQRVSNYNDFVLWKQGRPLKDFITNHSRVIVPEGEYVIDNPVVIDTDKPFYLHGAGKVRTTFKLKDTTRPMFIVKRAPLLNVSNVRVGMWSDKTDNKIYEMRSFVFENTDPMRFELQDSFSREMCIAIEGPGTFVFQNCFMSHKGLVPANVLIDHPRAEALFMCGTFQSGNHKTDYAKKTFLIWQKRGHLEMYTAGPVHGTGKADVCIETRSPRGVIRLGFVSRRFPDYVPQTTSSISISLPERN